LAPYDLLPMACSCRSDHVWRYCNPSADPSFTIYPNDGEFTPDSNLRHTGRASVWREGRGAHSNSTIRPRQTPDDKSKEHKHHKRNDI
ncbi:MAG: hypothetical protein ABL949_06585, partial [Fimbriimonadaceae bacterium]